MAFRDWYERNRKELNRKRRLRYHTDPEYRDKQITRAREDYEEKSTNRVKSDRRVFKSKGAKLISIGRLADALGRKVMTVRKYHTMGVIPQPTHFDSRGWRLYTADQYRAIIAAFDRFDRGIIPSLSKVKEELEESWTE